MKMSTIFSASAFASVTMAWASSANAVSGTSSISIMNSSNSSSEITFSGTRSTHQVNGDKIEVKDGILRINGVSYGEVSGTSIVKYSVRNNKKTVTVDGAIRTPLP